MKKVKNNLIETSIFKFCWEIVPFDYQISLLFYFVYYAQFKAILHQTVQKIICPIQVILHVQLSLKMLVCVCILWARERASYAKNVKCEFLS